MRRIISTEAVCLHTAPVRESSRLVTLLTPDHGRVVCLAKGARRPRSRFGAALDRCAVARVIYYWRESRSTYTLSDAVMVRSAAALTRMPARFLAAEQMTEFVLRAAPLHDPHPQLYQLLVTYLAVLEGATGCFPTLVSSFLLKAASFLGFRPELRRCLVCRGQALSGMDDVQRSQAAGVLFDAARGGIICPSCAGPEPGSRAARRERLAPDELAELQCLLYTPAEQLADAATRPDNLNLVLGFLSHHFDPLLLNSFHWPEGL